MLARIQVRYGMLPQFFEIMSHLVPILEKKGWRLQGAFVNSLGRLNRVYDLWEVPDTAQIESGLARAAQEPEFAEWAAKLGECVEDEQLEVMNAVPYWRADARG